jgi:hypothetical protein
MGGACSTNGGEEEYEILVGKPEGKRPLGRPNRSYKARMKGEYTKRPRPNSSF